jgi:hypothetical protein
MVYRKEGACPVPRPSSHGSDMPALAPPVRPAPATTLPPSCAGGEGEWEEIQIGPPPAAVEGVAS